MKPHPHFAILDDGTTVWLPPIKQSQREYRERIERILRDSLTLTHEQEEWLRSTLTTQEKKG